MAEYIQTKEVRMEKKEPYMISGEFHYFRVPKNDWDKRLDLLVESGANTVATYIPWILHEPKEGVFCFSKSPETDLDRFLNLCQEKGLDVIARPGPYQYSELRYCGLPAWLCEGHPEIMAQDKNGVPYNKFAVSYLHPTFLAKTENWFKAVLPIVAKHVKSCGGAIRYVQFDNEMCFHEWFGGWDYHKDIMLPRFEEYKKQHPQAGYHEFYFSAAAEYAGILAGWIRDAGIDCKLMHNAANPNMVSYFRDTVKEIGENFVLGVDMYFNLGMDFEALNPTPIFASNGYLGFEQLRLMGFTPAVLEMQAGNCADWPPTTPENLDCWYKTCLAMGMKGVNWYVFTGGPNPAGVGGDGDLYDYRAPVGPFGEVRPAFDVLKDFSRFVQKESWLTDAEIEYDYLLGLDWAHPRGKNDKAPGFGNPEAWNFLRKGVLVTGLCLTRMPKLVELCKDNWILETDKPLVISASLKMPRDVQDNIVRFVKNGGKALIAPLIPVLDENGEEYTALRDFLEADTTEIADCIDFCYGELTNIAPTAAFSSDVPKGGTQLAYEKFSGLPAAWEKGFPGGGKVIWLGLTWKHSKNIHISLLRDLMKRLNAPSPIVTCDNQYIWAVVRSYKEKRCLFVMNLFASPMEATITVNGQVPIKLQLSPIETKIILL